MLILYVICFLIKRFQAVIQFWKSVKSDKVVAMSFGESIFGGTVYVNKGKQAVTKLRLLWNISGSCHVGLVHFTV